MTVSNSWQGTYRELGSFITANPSIGIGMNIISIPGDVRPEFYRLFDTVRVAFLEERFPTLLSEAAALSENYAKAEQETSRLLKLEGVSITADLGRFLNNPRDKLIRGLFDPLFDLLKGKIDVETFDKEASGNIESLFGSLYQAGYQKWVALSLVKLLGADKSFDVITPHLAVDDRGRVVRPRSEQISGLELQESKRLSFKCEPSSTYIVPDFIVHSAKINRYVGVRSENGNAMWTASKVSEKREWYSFDLIKKKYGMVQLKPALSIYADDRPEDIALAADSERVNRPDLIVECMEQKGWYQKNGLETIKLRHDILKPKLGTFIASREPVPEQVCEKLREEFYVLVVGFDQSQLEPIISALMHHN